MDRRGYLSVANDANPDAFPGFVEKGDFEESDQELKFKRGSCRKLGLALHCRPEGGFGMHKGQTYMDCLQEHTPLGSEREAEPAVCCVPCVVVQELRRATRPRSCYSEREARPMQRKLHA